jgi:hypothetical protein
MSANLILGTLYHRNPFEKKRDSGNPVVKQNKTKIGCKKKQKKKKRGFKSYTINGNPIVWEFWWWY